MLDRTAQRTTAAAERMRRHRERRNIGVRIFSAALSERQIDELIRFQWLAGYRRDDKDAVERALAALLNHLLSRPA